MSTDKRILVTRSSMPSFEEYTEEIRELWESRWLTNMGKKHNELTARLKDYLGVEGLELLVNGHSALEFVLQAFDFEPGSEVITTPFTFVSTTHAIVRNNLVPVFCDIGNDDFCMDADRIESLITPHTVAILPVHVYGHICDVKRIGEIAEKHSLRVIYDAAHTFGETVNGQGTGTFGDASIFSFHATKVFHTIEGGCVCFRDSSIGQKVYYLKDFGIVDEENIDGVGANGKMNEFCSAMGLCNLRHVDGEIEKRSQVVKRYRQNLDGVKGIQLGPDYESGEYKGMRVRPNYAYFPVVFEDRDETVHMRDVVFEKLAGAGIAARKYFYPLTSGIGAYRDRAFEPERKTPVAFDISGRVLTLPLYADLEIQDVDRICRVLTDTLR